MASERRDKQEGDACGLESVSSAPLRLTPPFFPAPPRLADLGDLLQRRERVLALVASEAEEVAAKYGTPRRTAIVHDGGVELKQEDVTPNASSLVVFSRKGYIKRMSADTFTVQGLRGRGEPGRGGGVVGGGVGVLPAAAAAAGAAAAATCCCPLGPAVPQPASTCRLAWPHPLVPPPTHTHTHPPPSPAQARRGRG